MSGQFPTYHLAPNFSIGPPPRGLLDLGSIIDDLKNPDVINRTCQVNVDENDKYRDEKRGFVSSRSRMRQGDYGVWAKAVGIQGLGGEVSRTTGDSREETYRFKSIETIYFVADRAYITKAMNMEEVEEFVKGSGYSPVYIVTGLKIARGPAVSVSKNRKRGFKAEAVVNQPAGVPGDIGAKSNSLAEDVAVMEFEESDDFVIGIRVKKVRYRMKGTVHKQPGDIVIEKYDKGAQLLGAGDKDEEVPVEEVPLDSEMVGMIELLDGVLTETDVDGREMATGWIVPAAGPW
ncbi:hypothetical protein X797_011081 [Metarhizium robertsii]|uniref:Major facilitator superfamily MFS-1 n=2 Tax=Metarhizium robertsii TaxID=568076 RepID=E9F751_METRA|nr:major facilitator superfamily MFS-1 [Metarhizium robertsii ARSEF 23]EFY96381.1 major facilitator superfamily MFS-1 [Metarhizium robertsii ARSEF 23]EXU95837.1 hypothetical protein X797_011081 [Metarhizium robertsii]